MATSGTVIHDKRFAALLEEVKASMPDAESAASITEGFKKMWGAPPLSELELLTRRTYNLREAQLLLFFPEPVDMLAYVGLTRRAARRAG